MSDLETLYLQYMELLESDRNPDLSVPPFNNPEFHKILEGKKRVDRGLKSVISESAAGLAIPSIPNIEIVRELGRGGMGRVYLAKDTALDRNVAVKVIPKLNNDQVIKRFLQESRILAQFSHPNIVAIFQHGETPEHFYFVMQYSEGDTLKQIVEKTKATNSLALSDTYIQTIVDIVRQTADALACAHEAGVVHRDIKPSNILYDRHGHVRILDFGISKMTAAPSVTATHELVGTPYYLAPELVRGEPATPQTDIYALGVVLFESLALQVPFSEQTLDKLYSAIKEKSPPDIHAIRKDVPLPLNLIVQTCLEKSPAHRYQDVKTLIADLDSFRNGSAVRFAGARLAPRFTKFARHFGVAALVAAAVIALASWLNFRSPRSSILSPSSTSEGVVGLPAAGRGEGAEGTARLDPAIQIDLATDKGGDGAIYRVGEKIKVTVRANREGFLRLYYIQSDNTVVRLVPNRFNANDHIESGKTYSFPSDRDRFDLAITPAPLGKEKIVAVVSSVPFDDSDVPVSNLGNFDVLTNGLPTLDRSIRFKGIGMAPRDAVYNQASITITTTSASKE